MKLIIDIPEEIRNETLEWGVLFLDYVFAVGDAIKNGIPLDDVKAEIEASKWTDKDIRIERNALASGLDKAIEIIDSIGKGTTNEA